MKILKKASIRLSEQHAVDSGMFSFRDLMERAGNEAATILFDQMDCRGKKIGVYCGKGNNGGDGCVMAECLAQCGAEVTVVTPFGVPQTENARYFYERLTLSKRAEQADPSQFDLLIDALYGIGLDRPLDEETVQLIRSLNEAEAFRVAIDLPSGVEADSGKVQGIAFSADLTITFIALKPCFALPSGSDFCGKTVVADIGVQALGNDLPVIERPVFPKRKHNAHKGTFGTAVMFCGSYGMAGAAVLAARAALRSGCGIVKAVLCDGIYAPFTASVPEAVCLPVKQSENGTLPGDLGLPAVLSGASAVLIGCGCGCDDHIKTLVRRVAEESTVPLVIDADGINAIGRSIDIIKNCKSPMILTPHPGEMARLTGKTVAEVEADRITVAKEYAAKSGCILVLKGADTLVAAPNGDVFVNLTGNPGMAKGGCGDVLAGMLVSLLAQGIPPLSAAKAAVFLHGDAGDKAAAKLGERAMLASDLIGEI